MKKVLLSCFLFTLYCSVYAQALSNNQIKADSLFDLGEYASGITYYKLDAAKQNVAPLKTNYFYCVTQQAECAVRLNNLEEAQSIIDDALIKCPLAFKNEKASLLNTQAKIYYQQGQLEKATNTIQTAIDLLKNLIAGKEENYSEKKSVEIVLSECYNTEGLIDWISGNNEKALEYLTESLVIRKKIFGEQATQIAAIYNNMGLVYSDIDLNQALEYYEMALEIYQKVYPATHPALAIEYSNLGQIYRKQAVYNTSLSQYEHALTIWNDRYTGMHPNKAFVYSSMAQVYEEKNELSAAVENATKALLIYKETYGEKHPNTAACYTLLGSIYCAQKEYNKALETIQQSLISNCSYFFDTDYQTNPTIKEYFDGQLLLSTLTNKAIILCKRENEKTLRLKDLTLALSTYQSCDTLLDKLRQTRTSKNDKVALGMYSYDIYDKSVALCLLLSKNTFRKKYYLKSAYYFIERSKASVLQESIADAKAKSFAGIPAEEIKKEETFKTTITYLEQKLAKGINDETMMKSVTSQLFETKRNYETFIRSLEKNYSEYYNLKYNIQSISIDSLQKKLNPSDCMLEYLVSEESNSVQVFCITQKKFHVYSIPLTSTYEKYIAGMRNAIKFNNKPTFIKTAAAIYKQLIPKIPASSNHLIIIPDGKMSAIPFEALLLEAPEYDTCSYSKMHFLLNNYSVSYNYAGTLYENGGKTNTSNKVLLFAPVDFSATSDLTTLPGTLEEVNVLKTLYTSTNTTDVYTYASASKNILTDDSISKYAIIHLATHGLVDEEQPELSCIYTAGTSEENDRIHAGDMYNMHLNADLVTLSACQTGLGKLAKGEGMIGLSRALFYAGADNIMVSLWKVSDLSTQQYMRSFYTNYQKTPALGFAEASRQAKLSLIQTTEFNSPYYWSAFILIGK
jgi:CHAT domain-containing protein